MNEKNTAISKRRFLAFLGVLVTLIFLIRAEGTPYTPQEYCYYGNPTKIELVVAGGTEYDANPIKLPARQQQTAGRAPHFDFSSLNRFILLQYDIYARLQLKVFARAFPPGCKFISILQKHNVWHQSSGEDPFCG